MSPFALSSPHNRCRRCQLDCRLPRRLPERGNFLIEDFLALESIAGVGCSQPDSRRRDLSANGDKESAPSSVPRSVAWVSSTPLPAEVGADRVRSGRLVDPVKISAAAQRILDASVVSLCFATSITQATFIWECNSGALDYEQRLLAGRYVLTTSLTPDQASTAEVLAAVIEAATANLLDRAEVADPDIGDQTITGESPALFNDP